MGGAARLPEAAASGELSQGATPSRLSGSALRVGLLRAGECRKTEEDPAFLSWPTRATWLAPGLLGVSWLDSMLPADDMGQDWDGCPVQGPMPNTGWSFSGGSSVLWVQQEWGPGVLASCLPHDFPRVCVCVS